MGVGANTLDGFKFAFLDFLLRRSGQKKGTEVDLRVPEKQWPVSGSSLISSWIRVLGGFRLLFLLSFGVL